MNNHLTWFFFLVGGVVGLAVLAVRLEDDKHEEDCNG